MAFLAIENELLRNKPTFRRTTLNRSALAKTIYQEISFADDFLCLLEARCDRNFRLNLTLSLGATTLALLNIPGDLYADCNDQSF
jgi:hypothetical protein